MEDVHAAPANDVLETPSSKAVAARRKARLENVEDLYPLSPMQKMMLLHALASPRSDVLFNQFCYVLKGDVDVTAFRAAWQRLVDRHPVLRTAFVWKGLREPLQAVRKRVDVPFELLDWRNVAESERDAELERLRRDDRERGFDPARSPLLRVWLVRTAPRSFYLLWSCHHLLLDRWCLPLVLEELQRGYRIAREARPAGGSPRGTFRRYIEWIQTQKLSDARRFWCDSLRGFREPTLVTRRTGAAGATASTSRLELTDDFSRDIRVFARRHRLTASTVFQGALALVLGECAGKRDVVFGATVSGRPTDLDGVESMMGSFVNNLPVRARLEGDATVVDWLRALQTHQHERSAFEYVSAADILAWSDIPAGQSLFDTLLVWLAPVESGLWSGVELRPLPGTVRTGYPLTITVAESHPRIVVEARCSDEHHVPHGLPRLVERLRATLEVVLAHGEQQLVELVRLGDGFAQPAPVPGSASCAVAATELPSPDRGDNGVVAFDDVVLEECRKILGNGAVQPRDNFFEVGGNSLLATQLHARLEAMTGRSVPLLGLFQRPTVGEMAAWLQQSRGSTSAKTLRGIRADGSQPPLFCVASPEVNALGYVSLARHLDRDQPVYVLQDELDGSDARPLGPEDVPALAERYLDAMTSACPSGPVRLIGMCGGAHVALEIARQLDESGRVVDFVGVINTWSFYTVSWKVHLWRMRDRILYYRQRLRGLYRLQPRERVTAVAGILEKKARTRPAASAGTTTAEPGAGAAIEPWWARYRPRRSGEALPKYRGAVTVFRIRKQQFFRVNDSQLGWGEHAARVHVVHLQTREHLDILREPHVSELAAKLHSCLKDAGAAPVASGTSASATEKVD